MMSKMGFCKLWLRVIWKLRSVYCALIVHLFDVLTDILVIIAWISYPDVSGDNIDPKVMAYSALGVLALHKIVSFIAFWAKEGNFLRCLLQVLDLLIFEEIYLTHNNIITQLKRNKNKNNYDTEKKDAIDTTATFKFVRNLEAIFESIPQSVLQLVFIIRTGWSTEGTGIGLVIPILSIVQSTISMTNSILNNDNVYMTLSKWKKHKQRLPPTIPFIKHAIFRLCEVIYRICLCALFWVVSGGLPFSILIGIEFIFLLIVVVIFDFISGNGLYSIDDMILRLQMLIIMPSELVFALENDSFGMVDVEEGCCFNNCIYGFGGLICGPCCCCIGPATVLSTFCFARKGFYMHMSARIGLSMAEWSTIMIWPIFVDEASFQFLYSFDYGLYVFFSSISCYLLYSQYLSLFPDFRLPFGIPVRSMYGYAFTGDLVELQRVKPNKQSFKWEEDPKQSIFPRIRLNGSSDNHTIRKVLESAFYGRLTILKDLHQQWKALRQSNASEREIINSQLDEFESKLLKLKQSHNVSENFDPTALDTQYEEYRKAQKQLENLYGVDNLNKELRSFDAQESLWSHCWDICVTSDGKYNLETPVEFPWLTPALLASSNKQYHVVKYLEEVHKADNHHKLMARQHSNQRMNIANDYSYARQYLNGSGFWSSPYRDSDNCTCLMLALSNKKYDVVAWLLEEKNVLIPKDFTMSHNFGKEMIGQEYFTDFPISNTE